MRTVLAHGAFDILHQGHITHLEAARQLGDRLVVSITADRFINKGPGRPVFKAEERAAILRSLRCVDEVIICESADALPSIHRVKPDIFVKGRDYLTTDTAGNLSAERAAVESHGGEVVITDVPVLNSSSRLAKLATQQISAAGAEWVETHRTELVEVWHWLEKARALRVTCVGEHIIDLYRYVEPRGKSPKDNVVTWVPSAEPERRYAGGVLAVYGQVAAVAGETKFITSGYPVRKQRWIDATSGQKVFSEAIAGALVPEPFNSTVQFDCDIMAVADFGHGFFNLTPRFPQFTALTVQSNSLNWGMNRATRWKHADYISLNDAELSLALGRDASHDLRGAMSELASNYTTVKGGPPIVAVTHGAQGASLLDRSGITHCPAFAAHVVDRLGSGDAFYGSTLPLAALGAPAAIILLVGACASALQVSRVGNDAVRRNELYGFIKAVLA